MTACHVPCLSTAHASPTLTHRRRSAEKNPGGGPCSDEASHHLIWKTLGPKVNTATGPRFIETLRTMPPGAHENTLESNAPSDPANNGIGLDSHRKELPHSTWHPDEMNSEATVPAAYTFQSCPTDNRKDVRSSPAPATFPPSRSAARPCFTPPFVFGAPTKQSTRRTRRRRPMPDTRHFVREGRPCSELAGRHGFS